MLDIRLTEPQRHDVLTIFPLTGHGSAELPYLLLGDALAAGVLTITEVGSGTVPTLLASNDSVQDVLMLDGEQLIGGRQNRMTNRSILLPARSRTEIPVSCMEQGRWHHVSREMQASPQHSPSKVRKKAREMEARAASGRQAAHPAMLSQAQGSIWDEIADYSQKLGGGSPTGALDYLYGQEHIRVDDWLRAFPPIPGQLGLLAFVRGRPLGVDVIGGRALYAKLHDRLMRGYVMDALAERAERPEGRADRAAEGADRAAEGADPAAGETARAPGAAPHAEAPDAALAQRFLDRTRTAERVEAPTVGRGLYRVLTGDVVGGLLDDGDRLVHLSAFPVEDRGRGATTADPAADRPLPPPSVPRRLR